MKGRIFSATMLVIVLVTVLAVPASAGKPGPTITVAKWTWRWDAQDVTYYVLAKNITWRNAPTGSDVVVGYYACPEDTTPGSASCGVQDFMIGSGEHITAAQGRLASLDVWVNALYTCYHYFPAALIATVNTEGRITEVFASALAPFWFTGSQKCIDP